MILDYLTNSDNLHNHYKFNKVTINSSEGDFSFIETIYNKDNYVPMFLIADACAILQNSSVTVSLKSFEKG